LNTIDLTVCGLLMRVEMDLICRASPQTIDKTTPQRFVLIRWSKKGPASVDQKARRWRRRFAESRWISPAKEGGSRMPEHYSPKHFLQQVPHKLLRELFGC
jgi:hypothetical protein